MTIKPQGETPLTDALRAKFDQDWQKVRPEPQALALAGSHVDEAMTLARTLERALSECQRELKRLKGEQK